MWLNLVITLIQYTRGPSCNIFKLATREPLCTWAARDPCAAACLFLTLRSSSHVWIPRGRCASVTRGQYAVLDYLYILMTKRPWEVCRRPRGTCFIPGSYYLTNTRKEGWPTVCLSAVPWHKKCLHGRCQHVTRFQTSNHLGTILWTFKINICLLIS